MSISEEIERDLQRRPRGSTALGAFADRTGVTFSTFSAHATSIELCLFGDHDGGDLRAVVPMSQGDNDVWRTHAFGIGPGERYGFRAHGPYSPREGHRFNSAKLLLDPHARAMSGHLNWDGPVFGYSRERGPDADIPDDDDSAVFVPKSVVVDSSFDWDGDESPATPLRDTVIYEAHVKGLTKLHLDVPPELRGTYLGVSHPVIIDHLRSIGVTAIELLPVHVAVDEAHIARRGDINYWGYNSIGFFAPTPRYARSGVAGDEVDEFKQMVKDLHVAGIEVILDVVYNHTGEGSHLGPTLCFRGLDNASFYRLSETDKRQYDDFTGTGNTLDIRRPAVLRLIMDSLRYWVEEMHVDGFRFDLAPALAREGGNPVPTASLFKAIYQEPVLSTTKLIAEPWDVGPGGYMLGDFPRGWSEWNGKFRDATRSFWTGDSNALSDLAYRLTGSSDLFAKDRRTPQASINFVTVHDGFTLEDVVSYGHKHNLANGEENRDGANLNYSVNHGVEGKTHDPEIVEARDRHKRNLLAMLFLAQGVPMICAGDEIGRTQFGNNNAYCHDNELSWLDWRLAEENNELLRFVRELTRIRANRPALRRTSFFGGRAVGPSTHRDLVWYQPNGAEMTNAAWHTPPETAVAFRFSSEVASDSSGASSQDLSEWMFLMFNQGASAVRFAFPHALNYADGWWELDLQTTEWTTSAGVRVEPRASFELAARSVALWRWNPDQ